MAERQYDPDEVAAIFDRASKAERNALPASTDGKGDGRGMTLAALHDIGREVGITPEAISRAALSLDQPKRVISTKFIGLPIRVGQMIDFDRPVSETEWAALVSDLRTTFEARGTIRYDGPFRQWTNGNLQALLEPTSTGHRLRLQTTKGDSRAMMSSGLAIFAGATATSIALSIAGTIANPGAITGIATMGLVGIAMFASGALRVSGWARHRKAQIEEVIARLVRTTSESDRVSGTSNEKADADANADRAADPRTE